MAIHLITITLATTMVGMVVTMPDMELMAADKVIICSVGDMKIKISDMVAMDSMEMRSDMAGIEVIKPDATRWSGQPRRIRMVMIHASD